MYQFGQKYMHIHANTNMYVSDTYMLVSNTNIFVLCMFHVCILYVYFWWYMKIHQMVLDKNTCTIHTCRFTDARTKMCHFAWDSRLPHSRSMYASQCQCPSEAGAARPAPPSPPLCHLLVVRGLHELPAPDTSISAHHMHCLANNSSSGIASSAAPELLVYHGHGVASDHHHCL